LIYNSKNIKEERRARRRKKEVGKNKIEVLGYLSLTHAKSSRIFG